MRVEVTKYDAASAGIVSKQIEIGELTQHSDYFLTVTKYDAASAGIVSKQVQVSSLLGGNVFGNCR